MFRPTSMNYISRDFLKTYSWSVSNAHWPAICIFDGMDCRERDLTICQNAIGHRLTLRVRFQAARQSSNSSELYTRAKKVFQKASVPFFLVAVPYVKSPSIAAPIAASPSTFGRGKPGIERRPLALELSPGQRSLCDLHGGTKLRESDCDESATVLSKSPDHQIHLFMATVTF